MQAIHTFGLQSWQPGMAADSENDDDEEEEEEDDSRPRPDEARIFRKHGHVSTAPARITPSVTL